MKFEIGIILFSVILSAFYSGSEAAYYSANRMKLAIFKKKKRRGAQLALEYIKSPSRYLSTILIGNNIANILFGSFVAVSLNELYGETLVVFFSTSFILIFCEILPKSISRHRAEKVSMQNAYIIRFSEILFFPIIRFLNLVSRLLNRFLNQEARKSGADLSKPDIAFLFQESRYRGLIHKQDEKFIQRVIQLNEVKARQVMVHRTEIQAVPVDMTIEKIRRVFIRKQFTRMPVYNGTLDHIEGIIYSLDMLLEPTNLKKIIRTIPFIPETKPVLDVLQELRKKRASMAIVIDEYGGTAGLLTMEDIFEEIFGKIEDEHDEPADFIEKINDNEYRVRGRVEVSEINEYLNFRLPLGDYDTIAGLVISLMGKVPNVGEQLELAEYRIIVTRATRKSVSMVRIQHHPLK
ncbi:HlyC/CorC family transporter [candidate division KSB1 bacterium]|nr:HlyC/CorC family transporter [candidate division KSB1 bacterium]